MTHRFFYCIALLTLLHCGVGNSEVPHTGRLEIQDAVIRANRPNVSMTAGYLTIVNGTDTNDRLLSAQIAGTNAAGARVELHTMEHVDGVMRMDAVPSLDVPARSRVSFDPGANHLMILGLDGVLSPGDDVQLELTFEHAGSITVPAKVEAR